MRFIVSRLQRFRDVVRRQLGVWLFDKKKVTNFDLVNTKSILFIRNDAKLGDAIVSSGVLKKLKKYRTEIKIKVLTTSAMAPLFEEHFGVDQVVHLSKRPSYSEMKDVCEQVGSVDVVVSLNLDMKMKDIYLLNQLRSKVNIGLDSDLALVNLNISKQIECKHYADKFDYISSLLGIDEPAENYIVPLVPSSMEKAQKFLSENNIDKFVLINPFGSGNERKLNKDSINKIISVIKERDKSLSVVLLSSPDTRELLESMSLTNTAVHHFGQSESIYDAIAIVEKAKLVVSVDTSIVHIATGLNKPQIAFYREDSINIINWNPNSKLAKTIVTKDNINNFVIDGEDFTL
ncbi:lipopolysaccharide heptosyltransferase family protein [Vibrio aestuarianus]|uniref:glycosyltransferase family 9 protein n=1 Tax=Vibrio aestuarianus TaxID=28171 RepID=UPI00237D12FA|nr:glycosyltransferase family 9 protein [Vibrio aestuarianus]MDE1350166.1 lipopolysaccharide heptosyltransferase family protein [Vibrio aestuarianus]